MTDYAWNVVGFVFILAVVIGPLVATLLMSITNEDEEA